LASSRQPPNLQRFEILEELGHGNTGTIYRARVRTPVGTLRRGEEVALKILHPHLLEREAARRAFLREARAGMKVRHPNLVRVYAAEEVQSRAGRTLYLVLELLHGKTLRDRLREDVLSGEPLLRLIGRQVAGALAALHDAGLLHLDVKPENILLDQDSARAILMDLGFVRRNPHLRHSEPPEALAEPVPASGTQAESPPPRPAESTSSSGSDALFLGTPVYAAPELLQGARPGPAADLFALGVTLYECATGVRPFGDERASGLFEARRTAFVRKPSILQPRLSPFFDAVARTLLAEDPASRFPSARKLEEILREGERSSWWRERAQATAQLPVVQPATLPFAGRARELAILETLFQGARTTRTPRVAVLTGPPGVGKTRLALEMAAHWRGTPLAPPFLYGRALRLGRGSALRAVREALSRSVGLTPNEPPTASVARRLHAALPPRSAEILLGILRGTPFPQASRRRAFRDWFQALGREGPFLVLFDDLHTTAEGMWTFLEELLALQNLPALFLLARRSLPAGSPAAGACRRLIRHPHAQEIRLGPLAAAAMQGLVQRAFAPGKLPPALGRDLAALANGIPGTLKDVLALLRHRGDLRGRPGALEPVRARIPLPLTRDREEILLAHMEDLPPGQRDLLRWASLLAPPYTVGVLSALADLPEARVARTLDRLARNGWLKTELGNTTFARPWLREVAYRSLSDKEKHRRHRRCFEVLGRPGLPLYQREAARALHAHLGGLHREAVLHGLPVVENTLRQWSFQRAGLALERLWTHAEQAGWETFDPEIRVRLLVARARVRGSRKDFEGEGQDLKEAGELAHGSGDPRLRARVHAGLALHAREMGFPGMARHHLERARALRGEDTRKESFSAGEPDAPPHA